MFHPDVTRVGDVAHLGRGARISRTEPEFRRPRGGTTGPLSDRFVSRRPLTVSAVGIDRFRLTPDPAGSEVEVDGVRLDQPRDWSRADLARGVVIEIGRSVVLMWHLVQPRQRRAPPHGLVGESDALEELRAEIDRVAPSDTPVLIRGESGSGKELVARALHAASQRRAAACVCVNLAATPPSMAAAELFGHVKGAFTGATADRDGYLVAAHGGTLFLDEIGDAPSDVQVALLRAIETGEMRPIGGGAARSVDVRYLAATDMNLETAIADNTFRLALYHRLAGYEIEVPPLRHRRDDIGRLLIHFLRQELGAIGHETRLAPPPAGDMPWVTPSVVSRLARCDWPGNVRQLRNVARRLVLANRDRDKMRIPASVARLLDDEAAAAAPRDATATAPPADSAERGRGEISEDAVVAALRAHKWQTAATATALGISRTTLYALMDRSARIKKAKDLSPEAIRDCGEACLWDVAEMAEVLEVSKRGLQLRMRELELGR